MTFETPNARQLRMQLLDIEPVICRRLVVPISWDLGQLHLVLQAAFNWWDYHLHEFEIGGLSYGDPETANELADDMDPRVLDEAEIRLADFSRDDGVSFLYTYDFGDNWRHRVELEQLLAESPPPRPPAAWTARELDRLRTSVASAGLRPSSKCSVSGPP